MKTTDLKSAHMPEYGIPYQKIAYRKKKNSDSETQWSLVPLFYMYSFCKYKNELFIKQRPVSEPKRRVVYRIGSIIHMNDTLVIIYSSL